MMTRRSNTYIAPTGYVYDYMEPVYDTIKNLDGSIEQVERHLYANRLVLSTKDDVKNYKLVEDPNKKEG